jgi:hypothetical protein
MTAIEDPTEATLDLLRHSAAVLDPVPDALVLIAKESFTWRTVDAELAELVFDSLVDETVGVRSSAGPGQVRSMSFETSTGAVELEVDGPRIVGQIVPAAAAIVELRHPSGTIVDRSDDWGRFRIDGVPRGPVRITVTGPVPAISTDWFVV